MVKTEQWKDRRAEEERNIDGKKSGMQVSIRRNLRQKKLSIALSVYVKDDITKRVLIVFGFLGRRVSFD